MTDICREIGKQSDAMYRKGREPVFISFSDAGYRQALHQDRSNCFSNPTNPPTKLTYMGLPFTIERAQVEPVKVLDKEQVEGGIRLEVSYPLTNTEKATETVVLIGRALTAPQLSDIITAYAEANPGSLFSNALAGVVHTYGRFE